MFINYLKTAWRSLVANRSYSILNILGLATGMGVALLIGLWVYYQHSYDRFLPEYRQAYSVRINYTVDGVTTAGPATPFPLADAIKREIPGVRYVAQADWTYGHLLSIGDKKIFQTGWMVSTDFLRIFQYPFMKGNPGLALKETNSIVLSESSAKALFGDKEAMGQSVRLDDRHTLTVTGIVRDVPANSTMQFNYLIPFEFAVQQNNWIRDVMTNWRNNSFQTFVSLQPNADLKKIQQQIGSLEKKYNPEDYRATRLEPFLHALKDWHLYAEHRNGVAGGFIDYVRLFAIIGVLVLIIACINFMNLSTARSEKRAKEVGIRKTIGSSRKSIIWQFLVEAVVVSFIAFILSLLLVAVVLPAFNKLTKTTIIIPYGNVYFWLSMLLYVMITGVLAGSRPAFYLSSFRPVKVLKGTFKAGRNSSWPRKALVVLQFSCSVALIISTVLIYQQVQHAKNRPSGYDVNRLMSTDMVGNLQQNYTALKNDLLKSGLVESVTKSSSPVTDIWSNQRIDDWEGRTPNESLSLATVAVSDADYFKTMGMTFTKGRNFTGSLGADSLNVVLNEAAVARMRFKDPINQVLTWHDIPQKVRVIGVVKDALMASPFASAQPTIFPYIPDWSNVITYRLSPTANTQNAVTALQAIFDRHNASFPFQYRFIDDSYAAKFYTETLVGKLAGLFAALAIFISCLGLFGLAAYMAERRTKEIGIRKVLGASVAQVWLLLSVEFIVLVLIACLIASPVALYYLNNWLKQYDYRIDINPLIFVGASVAAVVITVLTVSLQAVKAALANPVKNLRTE